MRVIVKGDSQGRETIRTFELVDYMDQTSGDTAMARTTGFPATIAARMISSGDFSEVGVHFPEELFGGLRGDHLLRELEVRGVKVVRSAWIE